MSRIAVYGHHYVRVFINTESGVYHEFTAPGGAALLDKLLNGGSFAADDSIRREYAELQYFENKNKGGGYYAIGRRMGAREGETLIHPAGSFDALLVWDEGFGGLRLPDHAGPVLWASNKVLPDPDQFGAIAADCFLFLDADVLREAGAMISRKISWERTATELIWQMRNNPDISYLLKAPHILISFAEDGAVYLRRENGGWKASLTLTHGNGEGALRGRLLGRTDDAFVLMTAGLAGQFSAVAKGEKPLRALPVLKAAEALMTKGYTLEELRDGAYVIASETAEEEISFAIPMPENQSVVDPENWCVINDVGGKRIFDIAFSYVTNGAEAIACLPQLSFGALTTVDRWEIEAYQNIYNLILGYAADHSTRPLSIAVFGSPGSGKSFGVTQIAKSVLPGKVEKLEFNVSQFTGLADLGAAFQKVRDVILEGKLPLVFFDEFDSDRDGLPLGWVKRFLMPMQDGMFKDESGEHPLGKCVLVFAGGTAASFAEFSAPMQSADPDERQAFKNVKAPDFISRLKGSIDVLGPNQRDANDYNYILRRALLLRSLCERKMDVHNGVVPVNKNIIWAMLLAPQYKHGARSMEAILDMSNLEGNVWEPVSLPFYSQLALHVDADAFVKLVLRDVILNSYNESLAKAIHEEFLKERKAEGKTGPNVKPWEELPGEIRDSNRKQAGNIGAALRGAGYAYDAGDTPFPSVSEFDESTVLLLAEKEHIRWAGEKIDAGWVYGPVYDEASNPKRHPCLVDWDELPEEEREKDKEAVRNILPLLKSIGLRIYKTV